MVIIKKVLENKNNHMVNVPRIWRRQVDTSSSANRSIEYSKWTKSTNCKFQQISPLFQRSVSNNSRQNHTESSTGCNHTEKPGIGTSTQTTLNMRRGQQQQRRRSIRSTASTKMSQRRLQWLHKTGEYHDGNTYIIGIVGNNKQQTCQKSPTTFHPRTPKAYWWHSCHIPWRPSYSGFLVTDRYKWWIQSKNRIWRPGSWYKLNIPGQMLNNPVMFVMLTIPSQPTCDDNFNSNNLSMYQV